MTTRWLVLLTAILVSPLTAQSDPWVVHDGGEGQGKGRHIVLITGDEEYRSEEAFPMLGKILARRHGFRCTILFSTSPTGVIDPNEQTRIPGLHLLESADLVVLGLRFRELPDDAMRHFVTYLESGKPLIGIRTSTHAFSYRRRPDSPYARFDWRSKEWPGGFGRQILGDTWVAHHGHHGRESTRGVLADRDHPILRGVDDVWGPTDVYAVRDLPEDARVLVRGAVLDGMTPDAKPVTGKKNDPMMPIVWTRRPRVAEGVTSRVVCSTIGAATDFEIEGLRRLFVNACFWCLELDPPVRADVDYVGKYEPTPFGFNAFRKGVRASDHALTRRDELSVDRLQDTRDFTPDGFGRIRWRSDGSGYTTIENDEIVLHDPATGDRRTLVTAEQLTPSGADRALRVADYSWSADGKKLLVFTNTRRVWRYHTRGDYWVLDVEAGRLRKLGADLDEAHLQFAKLSPDATRAAYVYRNDLYVEKLAKGETSRLTSSGSGSVSNGTFDWVYEEEWGLRDGFRWSPDGRRIAYWQIDSTEVGRFPLVDLTSGLYPTLKWIRYPKAGTTNPKCRVGVIDPRSGKTTWIDLDGDPRDDYVARMEWAESSEELVLQYVNRDQNVNRVLLADARTGKVREVFRDVDDGWVDVCDDVVWLDEGRRFTFLSEREGWRSLWIGNRDGEKARRVSGDFDVVSVARIDEANGYAWVIASPDDPTRRFLYRIALDGKEADPERVTPAGAVGSHEYDVSKDGRFAIHRSSALNDPGRIDIVSLPDHRVVRSLVTSDRARKNLADLRAVETRYFRVPLTKGLEADGWEIRPPGFDPTKKYPVVVYVYGEPWGQTVQDRWTGDTHLWHRLLAQSGYVVISLDNRGTPAPRGRAWRKTVHGQIGILASADQASALRAYLARNDYADRTRVGVWGWSGGGSMTLNALFRYPELYRAGIAVAFVADQRYYDTIYQERYMGLPKDNPDGFRDGSPITFAKNLAGDLLLVYGTGDDNTHYQNCEALVNELVRHDKDFDLLVYPNRTHSLREGEGTRKHLWGKMLRFLQERLPSGPR